MKIVLIVPGGFDPSGSQRVIPALLWLTERLARRNEVHVCVLAGVGEPTSYRLAGAQVHVLGRMAGDLPGTRALRQWRPLLRTLASIGRPNVIHGFWAGSSGLLAGLAGRKLGVPAVLSIGGGELAWLPEIGYGGRASWRGRAQAGLALRLARAVTAGSRYAAQPLRQRYNVEIVPLGVDVPSFAASVERTAGPPWRLLHVASINRVKDQAMLLQALRLIVDQEPGVQIDWVGEDTLGGAMQRLCLDLGLEHHVTFHGFLPSQAVAPLFRAAHLHLLTSRHESQAVVVGEAAAAGLPTVGTAVGVLAELAPSAAWAVPVGDAVALAAGVLALLRDPASRKQLGRAAQAWARAHDADWTAARFEVIYADICKVVDIAS
ncbi:MAG: glycosyltransferase family 4 protein [Roseiflexaceae bacterium]